MTTGYTAALEDSKTYSFEQFVWGCARAFDFWCRDNEGFPPLHRELGIAHYTKDLKKFRRELEVLVKMSDSDLQAKMDTECRIALRERDRYLKESKRLTQRYAEMKACVEAWVPPSKDHEDGLKRFMLEQLQTYTPYTPDLPVKMTVSAYRKSRIKWLRDDIRHTEGHIQETLKCTQEVNDYFSKLNASVPRPKESK